MLDDFFNLGRDRFALREDALQVPAPDDVAEGRLRALDQRATDVRDTKGGAVRVRDLPDDDGFDLRLQVVFGQDRLERQLDDLNLDVNVSKRFRERVDFDEARVCDNTRKEMGQSAGGSSPTSRRNSTRKRGRAREK